MNLDITNILIGLIVLGLLIMLVGLAVSRRKRPRVERRPEGESPYVANRDRPYMKPPATADGPQGNSVADEVATATTDVAGEVLGIVPRPAASGPADDLSRLKGVGPKFVARLNELGITRYEQLAGLNANEAAHLDERMGAFQGRLARDRVVEQADYLARGDTDGFEEKFGKLGG
jgi:predicted flap endonuclease-1-like 5' DNA nuclease